MLGFFVCGLFAVGLLLTFATARGEAQTGGGGGTSGYAYSRPNVAVVNTVNASASRPDGGLNVKPFAIGGGAALIGLGAWAEARYARRQP